MGHYDNCRDGYCGKCGAAPGNLRADGTCPFCKPKPSMLAEDAAMYGGDWPKMRPAKAPSVRLGGNVELSPVFPTDEEIAAWADGFIQAKAFNRPIAIQIAVEAAKWVRGKMQQPR